MKSLRARSAIERRASAKESAIARRNQNADSDSTFLPHVNAAYNLAHSTEAPIGR